MPNRRVVDRYSKSANARPQAQVEPGVIVPQDQVLHLEGFNTYASFPALGTTSNIFNQGTDTYIDYEIRTGGVSYVNDLILQLTVQNNSASLNLVPIPIQYLVSFVEIYCGSNLIETIYDDSLFTSQAKRDGTAQVYNFEETSGFGHCLGVGGCQITNSDTTQPVALQTNQYQYGTGSAPVFLPTGALNAGFGELWYDTGVSNPVACIPSTYGKALPGTSIPSSAVNAVSSPATFADGVIYSNSRDYYLRIPAYWLTNGQILLDHVRDVFRIRVHFRGGTQCLDQCGGASGITGFTATSSAMTLASTQLIVRGLKLEGDALEHALKRARTNDTIIKGYVHRRQIINVGYPQFGTAGGSTNEQTLTGFNGSFIKMSFFTRYQGASQNQLYLTDHVVSGNALVSVFTQERYQHNNISLKMSNGQPIGFQQIPPEILRQMQQPNQYKGSLFSYVFPLYEFDFAENPDVAVDQGARDEGSIYMDGLWRYSWAQNFKNNASTTISTANLTGPVELVAQGLQLCNIVMGSDGSITPEYL